ncbi:hypothetical protein LCGC14_1458910 [marine sediment metagenome]|uniref:DUF4367 domain-containing protein n=1 Tax=marine sediment metagenome TaxID=412755 RepID=A0A0F9JFM4_9ZZZZ
MRDEDRADKLAKAIEEMVQGHTPEGLDDEELDELLQIAKIRFDAGQLAARAGAEAQPEVLKRLMARLGSLQEGDNREPDGLPTASVSAGEIASGDRDPEQLDVQELQHIVGLRHRMAERAATISESHREAVWQRVQASIQAELSEKRGLFRWPFRRRDRAADDFSAALDRMILGQPIWEDQDSKLAGLIRVARVRRAAAETANAGFVDQQARVWARIRPRLMAHLNRTWRSPIFQRQGVAPWPKLAAAGAVIALVIAALGPIPATGLAHHPAAGFARFVGGHIGVAETSAPPTVPPVTEVIEGNNTTAAQASTLLGQTVYTPTFMPAGYHETSSRYFSGAILAESGGVFILAYENSGMRGDSETILIFQEHTSSSSIAVEQGFAQDIRLSNGTPATWISGTWRPIDSTLTWGEGDALTIIFDLGGLRTVIQATDSSLPLQDIVAIADGLAQQATPD